MQRSTRWRSSSCNFSQTGRPCQPAASGSGNAVACAAAVKEAVRLGSYPLGPIMEPYGGMPAGPGMFALSWLDNRRLPVSLPSEVRAQHVSAVTRADGVMIWFVLDRSGLHLRCRYPQTPQARESVGTWLDAVCRGLVDAADATEDDSSTTEGRRADPGH